MLKSTKLKLRPKMISFFAALFLCSVTYGQQQSLWEEYKSCFVSQDGRVMDYYNGQISHSEGQSYGMFLAVANNDKATFDKLWQWTKNNLGVRGDHLFAWRWAKRPDGKWKVTDYNNATDGDILIAYALLKAKEKWLGGDYKNEGLKIIKSLRENLGVNWKDITFLLPGYYGYIKEDGFVLNPSYIIFPAYRSFAEVDERPFWDKVYKDGLFLIAKTRLSSLQVPPDWVIVKEAGISIFFEKGHYFGLEAVRTLLYLSWEDELLFPEGVRKILDIYQKLGYIPLWVDVANDSISLKPAPAGIYAIYARAAKKLGEDTLSNRLFKEAREKLSCEKNDYYSYSLYLLANTEIGK